MSSRSAVLTVEGLRKLSETINRMGGTLNAVSKETGISVSTIQKLIDRRPVTRRSAEKLMAALSVDESLLTEPVEAPLQEIREQKIKAQEKREQDSRLAQQELARRFFEGAFSTTTQTTPQENSNQIIVNEAAAELSETRVDDVQGIASAQLKILANYYNEGLTQAKASFWSAVAVSGIGVLFFLVAVFFVLYRQSKDFTLIPLISGAVIEVVAGINFYLYGQATKQLSTFLRNLEQTQRFLLANSICESLEGESQIQSRVELVRTVSSLVK